MTEEQLGSMTEQQIRARFHCAPAYYLQAKLERKRVLEGRAKQAAHSEPEGPELVLGEPARPDIALPGLAILDAALAEFDHPHATPAQHVVTPDVGADPDPEQTQQAILEAALEDYSNWPLLPGSESAAEPDLVPEPKAESDLERDLERELDLVLESEPELTAALELEPDLTVALESEPDLTVALELEPDLTVVLESEPELTVVLESQPELDAVLESEPDLWLVPETQAEIAPEPVPDNVTRADFGHRAARTVRVVSVVMDRKRPNMVRVVGDTTRRAG